MFSLLRKVRDDEKNCCDCDGEHKTKSEKQKSTKFPFDLFKFDHA